MLRTLRPLFLCSLLVVLATPLAHALVLSPVGSGGGPYGALPGGTVAIPAPVGAVVVIDMSGCFDLSPGPATPAPVAVACGGPGPAGNTLTAISVAPGVATFSVLGSATNPGGGGPGAVSPCAVVFIGGVAAGPINISSPDQNGVGGLNVADGSLFLQDRDLLASPKNQARSDFNNSGTVNPADGAIFLTWLFGAFPNSSPATCP